MPQKYNLGSKRKSTKAPEYSAGKFFAISTSKKDYKPISRPICFGLAKVFTAMMKDFGRALKQEVESAGVRKITVPLVNKAIDESKVKTGSFLVAVGI